MAGEHAARQHRLLGLLSSATAKVFMAPAKRLLQNMMAVTLSACVCVLGSAWMHAAPPPARELACPGRGACAGRGPNYVHPLMHMLDEVYPVLLAWPWPAQVEQ